MDRSHDIYGDDPYWMLAPGEYKIIIGMYRHSLNAENQTECVGRTESNIQVTSKREARYYFNQFTDLRRRIKKLERVVNRLF